MPFRVAVWHVDGCCVLKQWRVPLTRLTALKSVEVVKALPGWPPVERSASTELMLGRFVPLAECRGAVVIAPENLRNACRFLRPLTIVAGEPGRELRNAARMYGVMISTGEQRRAGRRAKRGRMEAVVAQPFIRQALERRRVHRATEGTRLTESNVVEQDQKHVRCPSWGSRQRDHVGLGIGVAGSDTALEARLRQRQDVR